ncbi:TAXI family TRAP transporter solute-binding subunit [Aliamphritea spongicola]|uniref:TAXI family TRAP transporter solute-binding subunit n=1 Tax=Aliamphritea spongicola TaxID=707589 RepID=UPI00196BA265|nr:TAXI family TRAP transporter solute-binding subunit [Aliamphritea spongicola]MBN3562765.1 TAXI family TRAP transporter solute-binding subunit [Aliamphritea spongicola]
MIRKKILNQVCSAAIALGVSVSANAEVLEWTSGQLGGGWFTMASGVSNLVKDAYPDLTLKIVPGGGTTNPTKIDRGISQFGWGLDTFSYQASKGVVLYNNKPHENLMMVGMSFSDIFYHMVASENAKYNSIEDLLKNGKDVNIAVVKRGSSGEQAFRWMMEQFGTSYEDLKDRGFKINHGNFSEMSSQFKDGQVDYVFGGQGLPGAAMIDMGQARKMHLVNFSDKTLKGLNEKYGFLSGTIPAETYEGVAAANTIKMATTLLVGKNVSEDTVYKVTKTLCENNAKLSSIHASMKAFDCATAFKNAPAPVHPGAAKYYKEAGYM